MSSEAPSKSELLERRGERDIVREGKSVLEERRDLLARMMWEQIGRLERLAEENELLLQHARAWGRSAVARHGLIGLTEHSAADSTLPAVQWQTVNQIGTPWLEGVLPDAEPVGQPPAPTWQASVEVGQAREAVQRLLQLLLQMAQVDGNLVRLTHAFRRTQRRVNALEHIILPDLEHAINSIQAAMDEVERDDLVRQSLLKRRHSRVNG